MFLLRVKDQQGNLVGEYSLAKGTHSIGRVPENAIQLKDRKVSRRHAQLTIEESCCKIEDRESVGGVFVNDLQIDSAKIGENDRVRIGDMVLELVQDKAEEKSDTAKRFRLGQFVLVLILAFIVASAYHYRGLWQNLFSKISPGVVSARSFKTSPVEVASLERRTFFRYWENSGEIDFKLLPLKTDMDIPAKSRVKEGQRVSKGEILLTLDRDFLKIKIEKTQRQLKTEEELESLYYRKMREIAPGGAEKIQSTDRKIQYIEAKINYAEHKYRRESLSEKIEKWKRQRKAYKIRSPVSGIVVHAGLGRPNPDILNTSDAHALTWVSENDIEENDLRPGKTALVYANSSNAVFIGVVDYTGKLLRPSDRSVQLKVALQGEYIFSISGDKLKKSSKGKLSKELRNSFANNGHPLSENAVVESVLGKEKFFVKDRIYRYLVEKSREKIDVYRMGDDIAKDLMQGAAVRVKILVGKHHDAPALLRKAVLPPRESPCIYVIRGSKTQEGKTIGKARKVQVRLGYSDKRFYELDFSLLKAKTIDWQTQIIVKGQLTISDGDQVEILTHE